MDRDIRKGLWAKPDAVSLRECTLGVVGVGNIGRAVARRAQAFGMTMLGVDPVVPPAPFLEETGMRMTSLRALLAESDFITLHCDLNPTSRGLIGRAELAAMRPSAYLINTARGPLIDEPALVDALRERRIAGAALDVFEIEPLPADSPLRAPDGGPYGEMNGVMDGCMLAPHNANSGLAARRRVHESTIANLLKGLRDERRPRVRGKEEIDAPSVIRLGS
jgi:D-3-phosphoglycerate dehydrogenase